MDSNMFEVTPDIWVNAHKAYELYYSYELNRSVLYMTSGHKIVINNIGPSGHDLLLRRLNEAHNKLVTPSKSEEKEDDQETLF